MYCPNCEDNEIVSATKVVDKRTSLSNVVRRRRECKKCKHRFTTYEIHRDNLKTKTKPIAGKEYKKNLGMSDSKFEII